MFVFGWLFSINPKNVSEEARPLVIKYKLECYKALYHHFTAHSEFLEEKQSKIESKKDEIQELKTDFSSAKSKLNAAEKELKNIFGQSYEDWDAAKRQTEMNF